MVLPSVLLPGNWHSFLRVDDNKTELFQYIAQRAIENVDVQGKKLVSLIMKTQAAWKSVHMRRLTLG